MVAPDNKGTKDQMIASLARGADKGVLVNNGGLETQDCMGIAQVLSKMAAKKMLGQSGKQSMDGEHPKYLPCWESYWIGRL